MERWGNGEKGLRDIRMEVGVREKEEVGEDKRKIE
jgi:hypothetical protein